MCAHFSVPIRLVLFHLHILRSDTEWAGWWSNWAKSCFLSLPHTVAYNLPNVCNEWVQGRQRLLTQKLLSDVWTNIQSAISKACGRWHTALLCVSVYLSKLKLRGEIQGREKTMDYKQTLSSSLPVSNQKNDVSLALSFSMTRLVSFHRSHLNSHIAWPWCFSPAEAFLRLKICSSYSSFAQCLRFVFFSLLFFHPAS